MLAILLIYSRQSLYMVDVALPFWYMFCTAPTAWHVHEAYRLTAAAHLNKENSFADADDLVQVV